MRPRFLSQKSAATTRAGTRRRKKGKSEGRNSQPSHAVSSHVTRGGRTTKRAREKNALDGGEGEQSLCERRLRPRANRATVGQRTKKAWLPDRMQTNLSCDAHAKAHARTAHTTPTQRRTQCACMAAHATPTQRRTQCACMAAHATPTQRRTQCARAWQRTQCARMAAYAWRTCELIQRRAHSAFARTAGTRAMAPKRRSRSATSEM